MKIALSLSCNGTTLSFCSLLPFQRKRRRLGTVTGMAEPPLKTWNGQLMMELMMTRNFTTSRRYKPTKTAHESGRHLLYEVIRVALLSFFWSDWSLVAFQAEGGYVLSDEDKQDSWTSNGYSYEDADEQYWKEDEESFADYKCLWVYNGLLLLHNTEVTGAHGCSM